MAISNANSGSVDGVYITGCIKLLRRKATLRSNWCFFFTIWLMTCTSSISFFSRSGTFFYCQKKESIFRVSMPSIQSSYQPTRIAEYSIGGLNACSFSNPSPFPTIHKREFFFNLLLFHFLHWENEKSIGKSIDLASDTFLLIFRHLIGEEMWRWWCFLKQWYTNHEIWDVYPFSYQ